MFELERPRSCEATQRETCIFGETRIAPRVFLSYVDTNKTLYIVIYVSRIGRCVSAAMKGVGDRERCSVETGRVGGVGAAKLFCRVGEGRNEVTVVGGFGEECRDSLCDHVDPADSPPLDQPAAPSIFQIALARCFSGLF